MTAACILSWASKSEVLGSIPHSYSFFPHQNQIYLSVVLYKAGTCLCEFCFVI